METIQTQTLTEKVSAAREAARDLLRCTKINSNKDKILAVKNLRKDSKDGAAELIKSLEALKFEINNNLKLNEGHPNYEEMAKTAEERTKEAEAEIKKIKENDAKREEEANKKIADIEANIAKWESGENKVDAESLSCVAQQILTKSFGA